MRCRRCAPVSRPSSAAPGPDPRRCCDGSGSRPDLPALLTNRRIVDAPTGRFLGCPDGWLPSWGVAIQVHSRQFHQGVDDQGGDRWADTVEKDSLLVGCGARVIGVSPWTLHARPRRFLARVDEVVALGPASPMPDVQVLKSPSR